MLAVVLAALLGSIPRLGLSHPERVAIVIECLYQNTGIATSIAFSVFQGNDASRAAGTPLYYGVCQTIIIPGYVLLAWKLGWTLAPPSDPFLKVLTSSYQYRLEELRDGTLPMAGGASSQRTAALAGTREGASGYVPPLDLHCTGNVSVSEVLTAQSELGAGTDGDSRESADDESNPNVAHR